MKHKVELLSPAGDFESLIAAVQNGADAVYIGGEAFGLRAKAKNFTKEEMAEGIAFAHDHGVRVHVTANILAHNHDLEGAEVYFYELKEMKPDALIIADPGMFMLARKICPEIDIHVSTQANNTNYLTYKFWYDQGAKRVVSARELSLGEIKEIRQHIPDDLEIESFIHGAMCISYSGRCLLSSYFTGRDANHGACTHPCRWKYAVAEETRPGEYLPVYENERGTYIFNSKDLCMIGHIPEDLEIESFIHGAMCISYSGRCLLSNYFTGRDANHGACTHPCRWKYAVVEEKRPGEYLPVYENERGTYIFNSKDLCMIEHIPEMIDAGIDSFKIEGRMKTALYVATVARTYRRAIDDYLESEEKYRANMDWYLSEISKCTYRQFTTGFYFGKPDENTQIYDNNTYVNEYIYLGIVGGLVQTSGLTCARIEQRNKFSVGESIEIMKPDGTNISVRVLDMYDEQGQSIESCPHSKQVVDVHLSEVPEVYDILRVANNGQ